MSNMNSEPRSLEQLIVLDDDDKQKIKAYIDIVRQNNPNVPVQNILAQLSRDPNTLTAILTPRVEIGDDIEELMVSEDLSEARRRRTGSQAIVSSDWNGSLDGGSVKIGGL
jgi:hypothetical protein